MTTSKPLMPIRVAYLLGRYPTTSNTFVYREISSIESVVSVDVYGLSRTEGFNQDVKAIRWVPSAHAVVLSDSVSPSLQKQWTAMGGRKKDLRRAAWLARQWRRTGVNAVHVHFLGFASALAAVACTVADIPLILTVHARGILIPDCTSGFALDTAHRIVTISEHTRGLVRERSGRDSEVIPIPVHHCEATPDSQDPFHILTVGRPVPKKGYDVLRAAVERLSVPRRWTVFGASEAEIGGPLNGLDARGLVPFDVINCCYQSGVDVFVLPCQTAADGDEDGVPVALLEAMARGVCVVTTPVGGIPELITDGQNGVLVPPGDPHALAAALERLQQHPSIRRRLGAQGRQDVRKYRRPDVQLTRLMRLFEDAIPGCRV